jgi:Domain of Unknown Function (DUF928)
MPTAEDEDSLEEDSTDRLARYSEQWRPVREVREPRFQGVSPRRDRPDRQLQWGPLLAAAAAGFLISLFGPFRSIDREQEKELANLQAELQSTQERAAQLESELSAAREGVGEADAPEPRASEREQQAEPEQQSEREPQAPPEPKREARTELSPEEVLGRTKPVANPEAANETETAAATPPTPVSTPSPEPSRTEPDQVALAEPQGSVSVYEVPDRAAPVVRSISRSVQVLAPERAGWTTEAQPTLYWHASQGMQSPGEFTLVREGDDEPLVRGRLPAPDAAGIQRIELSEADISLDEGASYRWTVSYADPAHSRADVAIGGIRRVAPPETLRASADAASVPERLDALERAGLWYDALDLVTRSIENNSGAKNLVARRNAMLARVGIELPSS